MNNKATSNSKEWDATSLRFTGFLAPDAKIQESDWWKAVVGESPDTRHIQEKKGSVKNVGRFEEGNLTLKMEPFRVDWFYEAIKSPEEPDMSGVLGSFNNAIPVFVDAMRKWFLSENLPSLQRIAFGAIILKPVETRQAGYRLPLPQRRRRGARRDLPMERDPISRQANPAAVLWAGGWRGGLALAPHGSAAPAFRVGRPGQPARRPGVDRRRREGGPRRARVGRQGVRRHHLAGRFELEREGRLGAARRSGSDDLAGSRSQMLPGRP